MHLVSEFVFNFLFLALSFLIDLSQSTIDINFAEYQYIADHLTDKECHRLVAALHFHSYEIPNDIDVAEKRLPDDTSCIDLLLHWNSTPKEGKGKTHVEVCHRLNQIGRKDLAEWLSKTTFHEISKNLVQFEAGTEETDDGTLRLPNVTEVALGDTIGDEAAWWTIDSVLSILLVFGLITCLFGCFFLCISLCLRHAGTNTGYKKLSFLKH